MLTVTDAKARLSELVAAVQETHEHVEITRNGSPAAVLVSPDELAALRETIAILSDAALVADLKEAAADVDQDQGVSTADFQAVMEGRRPA